jgi:uncharacterized membrane protein
MSKNILQALPELVQEKVISAETADQIRHYYQHREGKPTQVLLAVTGILGALLVGLGIILILAHNWDGLPRAMRTALAFAPLVLGQIGGACVLLRKEASPALRESAGTFLLLAIGACMALVSQVYHIPGNLSGFLLTWMLLGLPVIYLLRTSMVSLLVLLGITLYAVESRDLFNEASHPYFYWLLLAALLPHYYLLNRQKPEGNFTFFHHWLLPLSAAIALVTVGKETEELLVIALMSLFSLFCSLGYSGLVASQKLRHNGYLLVGTLGTVGLLLALSFDSFWLELVNQNLSWPQIRVAPECWAGVLATGLALSALAQRWRRPDRAGLRPLQFLFLVFILAFLTAFIDVTAALVLINGMVLLLAIDTIRRGARSGQLAVLNYGLLLVAALVACRFFDTDLSFVFRGILFVGVGAGFFLLNLWMLQKRKTHE